MDHRGASPPQCPIFLVLLNGKEYNYKNDIVLNNMFKLIHQREKRDTYTILLISRGTFWNTVTTTWRQDPQLRIAITELACKLKVDFLVDKFFVEQLFGHPNCLRAANILSRIALSCGFITEMSRAMINGALWYTCMNVVPVHTGIPGHEAHWNIPEIALIQKLREKEYEEMRKNPSRLKKKFIELQHQHRDLSMLIQQLVELLDFLPDSDEKEAAVVPTAPFPPPTPPAAAIRHIYYPTPPAPSDPHTWAPPPPEPTPPVVASMFNVSVMRLLRRVLDGFRVSVPDFAPELFDMCYVAESDHWYTAEVDLVLLRAAKLRGAANKKRRGVAVGGIGTNTLIIDNVINNHTSITPPAPPSTPTSDAPAETESSPDVIRILHQTLGRRPNIDRHTSIAFRGAHLSKEFHTMHRNYIEAIKVNSQRAVVVAPQPVGDMEYNDGGEGDDFRNSLSSLTSEDLNYLQRAILADTQTGDNLLDRGGGGGLGGGGGAMARGGGANGQLIKRTERLMGTMHLQDFQRKIESLKTTEETYGLAKKFWTAYNVHRWDLCTTLITMMPHRERGLFVELMRETRLRNTKSDDDGETGDPPIIPNLIHELPGCSKLISSFNSTVGFAELEELLHAWASMWESMISDVNMFMRRKNALIYKNGQESEKAGLTESFITLLFDYINSCGKILSSDTSIGTHGALTINELISLHSVTNSLGVKAAFSVLLGTKISDI